MPSVLEFNLNVSEDNCNDKRGVVFVKERINEILKLLGCKDIADAKNKLTDMMERIGVKTKLSELKIDEKGVNLIIEKGFTPYRMNNNPRYTDGEDLRKILEGIL